MCMDMLTQSAPSVRAAYTVHRQNYERNCGLTHSSSLLWYLCIFLPHSEIFVGISHFSRVDVTALAAVDKERTLRIAKASTVTA